MKYLSAIIILILLLSCSLDYTQIEPAEAINDDIPNTEIMNFKHISVRGGTPSFKITAASALTYENQLKTYLSDIYFEEFDEQLNIVTFGTSNSAVLYTDTEDAEMRGDIEFYSTREEAWLWSDYLYWDNDIKHLSGSKNGTVSIKTDDGTSITGKDFQGDLKKQEFIFNKDVSGTYEQNPE